MPHLVDRSPLQPDPDQPPDDTVFFRREYNKRAPDSLQVKGMPYVSVKLLPQSDFTTIMKQYMHKGLTET